jgi:hypothetical protein
MPNGESKNWIRLQITLESFYILYDRWPLVIHVYPFFIRELEQKLSEEDFRKLQSKIRLVPDEDNPFLALDDSGNRFDYANEESPDRHESVRAIDWLGVREPDYYD